MQNTTESNKIIADFDDNVKYKPYYGNHFYDKEFSTYSDCEQWIKENATLEHKPELGWNKGFGQYDTSWAELMPVIDKIESLGYWIELSSSEIMSLCEIGLVNDETAIVLMATNTKIKAAYNAVVEFITEYNKTKK